MNRLALLAAGLLAACASPHADYERVAQLHVGMPQEEVNALLGPPRRSTSQGALTVYDYVVAPNKNGHVRADTTAGATYYVIVGRDGRVRSFGQN